MKKYIIVIVIVIAAGIIGYLGWIQFGIQPEVMEDTEPDNNNDDIVQVTVNNFLECEAAGFTVLESYPRQCQLEDGQTFTENIGNELEKADLIQLDNPRPNHDVFNPVTVSGQARGTWFNEGSFPVVLTNADGLVLAEAPAQTEDDWMTEEFISFEVTLRFIAPATDEIGSLTLRKANPSGLPENDDALEIPVVLAGSGLKPYANENFGIAFQINKDVTFRNPELDYAVLNLFGPTQVADTELFDGLAINIHKLPLDGKTGREAAEAEVSSYAEDGEILEELSEVTLAEQASYKFVGRGLGDFTYFIVPMNEETYLRISILFADPGNLGFGGMVQTFLSTLTIL
jgi:hypothetical protein